MVDLDGLAGRRVSLRHRIGERDGRPLHSDAVGELTLDGDAVVVATRRGPVRVDRSAVAAVRAVPPAPPRRASLTAVVRLESLCADAWPAQVDEPLGGWRLRAAGGYTGRANSALAIGDPGLPVPAALDAVQEFARRNGIGPRVQAPVGSPWDRAVAAEGWVLDEAHEAGAEVTVQVADLTPAPTPPTTPAARGALDSIRRTDLSSEVEWGSEPGEGWWGLAVGAAPSPAQRCGISPAQRCVISPAQRSAAGPEAPVVGFGLVRGGPATGADAVRGPRGGVLGTIRAAVVADHLHLSLLAVEPAARRQGLATALLAAAAGWGRDRGARWAVLQVALHNTAARALYEATGFVEHHRYRYLVPPD